MLDSPVFDAAFGLIFVFYAIALICAGAVEMIATRMKKRSKYLLRGIRDLLKDIEFGEVSLTPNALKNEAVSEQDMYQRRARQARQLEFRTDAQRREGHEPRPGAALQADDALRDGESQPVLSALLDLRQGACRSSVRVASLR